MIGAGVHIYIYVCGRKKYLNRTLAIDSPFQTLALGLLVECTYVLVGTPGLAGLPRQPRTSLAHLRPGRKKGQVYNLRPRKNNEYTQTTLLGVELLCVTLRMNITIKFTISWQPGCTNMASTNVCRLDSRSSVNIFTAIGLKNK